MERDYSYQSRQTLVDELIKYREALEKINAMEHHPVYDYAANMYIEIKKIVRDALKNDE